MMPYPSAPPQAYHTVHQPQFAHHGVTVSHTPHLPNVDQMVNDGYKQGDDSIRDAIARSRYLNGETRSQCLNLVKSVRVHRNLLMYTYVHLVSCGGREDLVTSLKETVAVWRSWHSLQQLTHHFKIRDTLFSFLEFRQCRQHQHLLTHPRPSVIQEDHDDLLYHLIHCGRDHENDFYRLPEKAAIHDNSHYWKESEKIVELLAMFLREKPLPIIACRLRSLIYRMSRKSAYLPLALEIPIAAITLTRERAGAGASGTVCVGHFNRSKVAVKTMAFSDLRQQKEYRKAFASEAILWSTLRHPNIVPFLGVVVNKLDISLVSVFFKNGNIRRYLEKHNDADRRALGRDIAKGLAYIHELEPPIYHGDIKGDNILVNDQGNACLGDFGQSYATDSRRYLDTSRVGRADNNPIHWMAPELLRSDQARVTAMSDMYSFGCVLYEMVSGAIPFQGCPPTAIVNRVTRGDHPERPRLVDSVLWRVAVSCWETNPNHRPTARGVVSELR
ncbi:kinase-like protein [Paxillus ammoniavirescens]|nr:kinase-like protein [Paxillus ammoniavirescens]